jgi:hypothetical protein
MRLIQHLFLRALLSCRATVSRAPTARSQVSRLKLPACVRIAFSHSHFSAVHFLISCVCAACDVGSFAAAPGSSGCTSCPIGQFAASAGSSSCSPCANGTYSALTGSTTCLTCAGLLSLTLAFAPPLLLPAFLLLLLFSWPDRRWHRPDSLHSVRLRYLQCRCWLEFMCSLPAGHVRRCSGSYDLHARKHPLV